MMDWRGWVRTVLKWLGLVGPESVPHEVKETAVSPPLPASQPEASSIAKSTTAFSLRLLEIGPDRESVIHLLHEMSGLSLRQIRALVDAAPAQVLAQIDAHSGRAIQKRLESLGAVCELVGGQPEMVEPPAALPDAASNATHPDNTFFLFGDYNVVLQSSGPWPVQVIQILRDLLNSRTLADVERLVADAPQQIVQQVPLETARTIKNRLEQAGAAVEIRRRNHNG
jgi:ribosomal protein L7/L12